MKKERLFSQLSALGMFWAAEVVFVPLFKEQIAKGGPITVTDFRMTRYFMTIPEASRLVIQAGALMQGGEVFCLGYGRAVKILDLAKKMITLSGHTEEEIQIQEAGIRPGESFMKSSCPPRKRSMIKSMKRFL